jgi:hypothetical protein
MYSKTETTLSILFETPEEDGHSTMHEREVKCVPIPIIEQIEEDFVRLAGETNDNRYQLYRIGEGDEERMIALDFGEIIEVSAAKQTSA